MPQEIYEILVEILCQECKTRFKIVEVDSAETVICPYCNNKAARFFYITL